MKTNEKPYRIPMVLSMLFLGLFTVKCTYTPEATSDIAQ